MTEDEKKLLMITGNLFRRYPTIIIVALLFLIVVPGIILLPYWIGDTYPLIPSYYQAEDILGFWGTFLGFLGTITLGTIAVWQNKRLSEENQELMEKEFIADNRTHVSRSPDGIKIIYQKPDRTHVYSRVEIIAFQTSDTSSVLLSDLDDDEYFFMIFSIPFNYENKIPNKILVSQISLNFNIFNRHENKFEQIIFKNISDRSKSILSKGNNFINIKVYLFINIHDQRIENFMNIQKIYGMDIDITFSSYEKINSHYSCTYYVENDSNKIIGGHIKEYETYRFSE